MVQTYFLASFPGRSPGVTDGGKKIRNEVLEPTKYFCQIVLMEK